MEFEFDRLKSKRNKEKHGIDFVEAQLIWEDADRIEIPARTEDEPRYLVIGRIERKCWSAIITYRSEKVRIIAPQTKPGSLLRGGSLQFEDRATRR